MAKTIVAAVLASAAMGGASLSQGAAPISAREVVGDWTLAITPAEREDLAISVESRDGGQPDFPLTITAQAGGSLTCAVRDRPAQCRIDGGRLIVVSASRSGGGRMTFTLTDRNSGGFSGTARVSVRFLPIGGEIGTVSMTRR